MGQVAQSRKRRIPPRGDTERTSLQVPKTISVHIQAEATRLGVSKSSVIVNALAKQFGDVAVLERLLPLQQAS